MINIEATIRWKGYNPEDLSPMSGRRVWANCDECGNGKWVPLCNYKRKNEYLCKKCSCSGVLHPMYGKHHSKESCEKIKEGLKGKEPWNKGEKCPSLSGENNPFHGKKHLEKTRKKMSVAKFGKYLGKNNSRWNGGRKIAQARSDAKRRELFGFNPINTPQENSEGHHLNLNDVLFIPKELHKSIAHSVTQNRHMDKINNLAEEWYLHDQGAI